MTPNDAACDQIANITNMGRSLGRALIIAIDALEAIADEPSGDRRYELHDAARNDIHAILGEVL
jgi:hypothetical protein